MVILCSVSPQLRLFPLPIYLSPYTHLSDTITESFTEILTETHLIADAHILSLTELYIESLKDLETASFIDLPISIILY